MPAELSSLLLGFTTNPGVEHLLCAYITRTGVVCGGVRSHAPGEITFDVTLPPPRPREPGRPAIYKLAFDTATGEPKRAELIELGA